MVEILATKAVGGFVEAGLSQVEAVRYATFAFFAGIAATWVLGKLVHALAHMGAVLRKRRVRQGVGRHPGHHVVCCCIPACVW